MFQSSILSNDLPDKVLYNKNMLTDNNSNDIFREVNEVLKKVKKDGDKALEFFTKKFDRIELPARRFSISKEKMEKSYYNISSSVRSALLLAKKRIKIFHEMELKRIGKSWSAELGGVRVGQMVVPLFSVGLYVPGGRTSYPSTVLMASIPARVAGVRQIVMVTPFKNLTDEVMAAAFICGVDRCFAIGGPAAIAALAFGTHTIPKVEKIVGPGNRYVTEAKRQLFGQVGIDGLSGPSEIAVWADSSADYSKIALNLLAQAEHDPDARSCLLSCEKRVLSEVKKKIPKKSLTQIRFMFKKNENEIIEQINEIAPEHLLLVIKNVKRVLPKIRCAGAIFLGVNSPVALGDYVAGPSHVLPTGQAARFSSGLSVKDFLRWSSIIENKSKNSAGLFKAAKILAETEGLRYHALSLSA